MNTSSPGSVAGALERGRELVKAQREALVSGNRERIGQVNKALSDWLAHAASGFKREPPAAGEIVSLRAALAVNASVAASAGSNSTRALEALLAGPNRTYGADGRSSVPVARRSPFSA